MDQVQSSRQVVLVAMAERMRDIARREGNATIADASLSDLILAIEDIIARGLLDDLIARGRLQ
jgi:hypothetical protein